MKKNIVWIIIVILLVIAAFLFGKRNCSSGVDEVAKVNEKWEDSLDFVQKEHFKNMQIERAKTEYFMLKLDTCENGLVRPLTPQEELALLKSDMEALKNQPPKIIYMRPKATTPPPPPPPLPDVPEQQMSNAFSAKSSSAGASSSKSVSSSASLSDVLFEGEVVGDIGTTITTERKLVYYIKDMPSIIGIPYVNGTKEMTLGADSYWYYIDFRTLSEEEIANAYFTWNIKTDDVNWGGGTYPCWLPHELTKPLINDVRGFEYGKITDDDLNKMSQRDSRVWSPNNPSGIFQPLPGISKTRNDTNFWHGWNFRTRVNYKRVTK